MSHDGSHLNGGLAGIVPMLNEYGFTASQDIAEMLQQFTTLSQKVLLPYAAWMAIKWMYHHPDDKLNQSCAVFLLDKTLWIYDGIKSRVIKQMVKDHRSPNASTYEPANFKAYTGNFELIPLEDAVHPAELLWTFTIYFLGFDIDVIHRAKLLQPFKTFQLLIASASRDSPGMQYAQPPLFPQQGLDLNAVGMQGLTSPQDLDIQIEKRLTQDLGSIAKSASLVGGGSSSASAQQQDERNAQITRTVVGWYMLVKVMLRRPTIMRLLSLPNMEEYLQQASISNSSSEVITSYDTSRTLQEWLNIIYVDAASFMQPDVSSQLSRLSPNKYQSLRDQISIDTSRYRSALSTYPGLSQDGKDVINIEYLAMFFESLVSENVKKAGHSEIALVYETLLRSMLSWMSRADSASQIIDLLEDNLQLSARKTSHASSNIITYVRVTTRPPNVYNKRFDVQVDADQKNALYVGYCNDNVAFYGDDKQETEDFRKYAKASARAQVLQSGEVNILQYPYRYLFGPFTRVLTPDLSNEACAKRCTDVIAALLKEKSVFLVGYGASGAGKTSSLIYLNDINTADKDRDGILIHVCHHEAIRKKYSQMSVSVTEMFASYNTNSTQQNPREADFRPKVFTDQVTGKQLDTVNFVLDQGRFKVQSDVVYHNTRFEENTSLKGQEMGAVILYLLDKDRKIAATTNNPVSSRSHTLIFVRMGVSTGAPYLIVGDFAGVENRFDCNDWNVLNKFRKVGKNGRRFYDDYHNDDNMFCDPTVIDHAYKSMMGGAEIQANEEGEFEKWLDENNRQAPITLAYEQMQNALPCLGTQRKADQNTLWTDVITKYYSKLPGWMAADDQSIMQAMGLVPQPSDCGLETVEMYTDPDRSIALRSTDFLDKFDDTTRKLFISKPKDKDPLFVHAAYASRQLMRWALSEQAIRFEGTYGTATIMRGDLASVPLLAQQDIRMFGFDFKNLGSFWKASMTARDLTAVRDYIRQHAMYGVYKDLFIFSKGSSPKDIDSRKFESCIKELLLMRSRLLRSKFAFLEGSMDKLLRFHQRRTEIENKLFQICNCRSYEGVFINDSLRQTRDAIAAIVIKQLKQQNAVKVVPPFFDTCMYMQCRPLSNSCYSDAKQQQNVSNSAIFSAIQRRFQQDSSTTSMDSLIIAIFSVLNLSRDANNPPAAPYIDIEDIKQEMDRMGAIESLKGMQIMPSLMSKLKEDCRSSGLTASGFEDGQLRQLLEQLKQKANISIELDTDLEIAAQKLAEALPVGTWREISKSIGGITVERKFLSIAARFNQVDEPRVDENKLNALMENVKMFSKQIGEDVVNQVNVTVNDLKSTFDMNKASSLVLLIDNINAISALGTLEFTDRMAKYAMTNKTCRISDTSSEFIKKLDQSMLNEIRAFKRIGDVRDNDSDSSLTAALSRKLSA